MAKSLHTPLLYERGRLLYRGKRTELWEGQIRNQDYIIRRSRHSGDALHEFMLQSQICHPLFLSPEYAGVASGFFLQAIPLPFETGAPAENWGPEAFTLGLIALAHSLAERHLAFRWNSGELVYDSQGKNAYLPGFPLIREVSSTALGHFRTTLLRQLQIFVSKFGASSIGNILKKWERRKQNQLEECLGALLQIFPYALPGTVSFFESLRKKELELVTGLLHLAECSRGRVVLFRAGAGEGKSTLIRQIYRKLLPRNVLLTGIKIRKEERPYQIVRDLIDQFLENTRGYRRWQADTSLFRMLDGSDEASNDLLFSKLLELIRKYSKETSCACVFLLDDVDLADSPSLSLLLRLWNHLQDLPVLLIATSRRIPGILPDATIHLSLEPIPLSELDQQVIVPSWKPEQRRNYLTQIYHRTSGNPLLFHAYLIEIFRLKHDQLLWKENEWFLQEAKIPEFPEALIDFYWKLVPALSEPERRFLEKACIQGDAFDADLIDEDRDRKETMIASLTGAGILQVRSGRLHFQHPLLAEALYQRMGMETKKGTHLQLAQRFQKEQGSGNKLLAAGHLVKAREVATALHHVMEAVSEESSPVGFVLPLLEELEATSSVLAEDQKRALFFLKGDLLSRTGKYASAAASYRRAMEHSGGDAGVRMKAAVKAAESYVFQNDIHSAIQILNEHAQGLETIRDEKLLFQYYFTRGICSWHRGSREPENFARAFDIALSRQDYQALARGYRQQAALILQDGALQQAEVLARKALRFARKCRNQEEAGHVFRILASIAWRQSRYKVAERLLKKSILTFQKWGHSYGMACGWNLLANIYVELYRFVDAIRAFQKAILLFHQADNPMEVCLAQFNLGLVYLEQGKLRDAENIFLRCCALDRKSGNKHYYAYDLRALAVHSILRGFHKKAERLLNRTIQICEDLGAEGDVLQSKMILLLNNLEQKNHRRAEQLVPFLCDRSESIQEPRTLAEIHYLLGYYFILRNDSVKAFQHIEKSLSLSRKIGYFKMIGKDLILKLILQNEEPGIAHPDLREAVVQFRKSRSDIEFCDHLLKLFQAYPLLAKKMQGKLSWMEKVYRSIRNRPGHQAVRRLLEGTSARKAPVEPLYEWWQDLMRFLDSQESLETKFHHVLSSLLIEFRAGFAAGYFLDPAGTYRRMDHPADATNLVDDLPSRILALVLRDHRPRTWDLREESEMAKTSWAILHEVRSVLAVPVVRSGQLLALWYLERRSSEPEFSTKDLHKATFFSVVSAPLLENSLQKELQPKTGFKSIPPRIRFEGMVGSGRAMREVYRQLERLAPLDVSVLITGESGTGKELIARSLHQNSRRPRGPFVPLNCSALPETLIESELFGYHRGAFTGATSSKAGLIEKANGGSLFLDEIGDLSAAAQAKLLRAIQEKEIQRLGDTVSKRVDVRFLFATHKDLKRMTGENEFREDLFYRISAHTIHLPPLRERQEDIPELLAHLTRKYSLSFQKGNISFSPAAMRVLVQYPWHGNVREMENVVQQILLNSEPDSVVQADDLPPEVIGKRLKQKITGMSLDEARTEFEREFLLDVLNRFKWNKTRASKELKISRQGLIQLIQRLGLQNPL